MTLQLLRVEVFSGNLSLEITLLKGEWIKAGRWAKMRPDLTNWAFMFKPRKRKIHIGNKLDK